MRKHPRTAVVTAMVIAGALVGIAEPANAQEATQLSGLGTHVEDCSGQESLFTIEMHGDLEGCWYTDSFDVVQETSSGIYQERGTETFVGCLNIGGVDVACGSFSTTYKFTAKFAPDGQELRGRCQHPIVAGSGTGGFSGATGRVDFKDDVVAANYPFRGHISLN